jgi:hypothetical protein
VITQTGLGAANTWAGWARTNNTKNIEKLQDTMTTLSIVYFPGSGHTTKMAEAIAKGASTVADAQVNVLPIQSEDR